MAPAQRHGSSFVLLWTDLRTRFVTPIGQVTFWVFLLIGIIVCGGAPIWCELFRLKVGATVDTENLRTAVNCYFPAIGGAAAAQLMFAAENRQKYLTSFSFLAAFFFFIATILTLALEKAPPTCFHWFIGVLLSIFAILMWWLANGLDRTFRDDLNPDAPLGGSPDAPLVGNTAGFTT